MYGEGEEEAGGAVSILQHRGYLNAMLLSGGIKLARDKVGPPLITTNDGGQLALQTAIMLQSQLSVIVLPPLTVSEGADWFANTTTTTTAATTTATTTATTARSTQRSLDGPPAPPRPRPWR